MQQIHPLFYFYFIILEIIMERERFSSRLGFILISAGCAIGLGNVWRFPWLTGQYGGAAFVLIYLLFLLIMGIPIMAMEFSVGRASQQSSVRSFKTLKPDAPGWNVMSFITVAGNYLLMAFYTTVGGWMLSYFFKTARGDFSAVSPEVIQNSFGEMLTDPVQLIFWMILVVMICFLIVLMGLKNGVERITKVMMICLLSIMVVLIFRAVTLPGASEGLSFYLKPDFSKLYEADGGFFGAVFAAMGQAFFTLSLGIGSLAIFGSYIGKDRSLTGEAISITALDTFVALLSGLIIFPSCTSFGVAADQGPALIFVTLPNIFNQMPFGQLWGSLFFVFMSFAAFSTIIAVFENIIAFAMDLLGWTRKKSVLVNLVIIILISLPCALGFNILSDITIPHIGDIQSIEDFIVSNNLLPLGALGYLLFCTRKWGWGWESFLNEADSGKGIHFPSSRIMRFYLTWILPLLILFIFAAGYIQKFTS